MTVPDAPAVSVVVPTRDRPRQLADCLAALEAQTAEHYEVVVVDDGSVDADAVASVVTGAPHARLVQGEGRGPAAARNRGAAAARAPVVCFTDDDCRPPPGWIDALAGRAADADVAIAGPTRNGRPRNPFATASQAITNHLVDHSLDAASGRLEFAPTSTLACRATLARHLPFDERFPLAAGEDRDWCARLAAAGGRLCFEPSAWLAHHQDLSWRGFWRQQVRYGRGAYRFHRDAPRGRRLQAPRFYTALVRIGFAHGLRPGVLVLVAQVATAVGIGREALAARSD
jgi:glycosyltransferase involved in cell wall biosynthesis